MSLYLFNEESRTLFYYDIPMKKINLESISGLNLERNYQVTDTWGALVSEGTLIDDASISALAETNTNISTIISYPRPDGCTEQHSKSGSFALGGPNPLKNQNFVDFTIKVTSENIQVFCPPASYTNISGQTAVWWGDYSNPVIGSIEFSGVNTNGGTGYRDYIL